MAIKITTLEIRQKLGDLLNRVSLRQDEFIIERKGVPLAALVPVEKIDQMLSASRLHLLSVMKGQRKNGVSQDDADKLANEAKHASRKKRKRLK